MKKKILVLATDYSNNDGKISLHYIHSRNIEYVKTNIEVTVLNFSAKENYVYENIKVITEETFLNLKSNEFDILVSHAPNIRHHFRFLRKYDQRFKDIIMFFHGHEVLSLSKDYPEPYSFMKKSRIKSLFQGAYDNIKFSVWKKYIKNNEDKLQLVFVSDWMFNKFSDNLKVSKDNIKKYSIIHNSIGVEFETEQHKDGDKEYDFVTVRSMIDFSKYAVDVVVELARKNPESKFLLIGKGNYFLHNEKPNNLVHLNTQMNHKELLEHLNNSKIALMPTRTDAQGVMACEMLSFGMPLITSDIKVCKEIFNELDNVWYINNSDPNINIERIYDQCKPHFYPEKFHRINTVEKEIALIKSL